MFSIHMRVLDNDKYQLILDAARNEFINKGFKNTSMRIVAKKAGVGVSNIYSYFEGKNELFLAIVMPAKKALYAFIEQQHTEENIDFTRMSTFCYQEEVVEAYISLIYRYKEEIRLLLYHSDGSSLANFRDVFTDYLTKVSNSHMAIIKRYYPQAKEISSFFIHTLSSWMVSILGEIVTHNLSKQKVRSFFEECFKFEIAGWRELVEI